MGGRSFTNCSKTPTQMALLLKLPFNFKHTWRVIDTIWRKYPSVLDRKSEILTGHAQFTVDRAIYNLHTGTLSTLFPPANAAHDFRLCFDCTFLFYRLLPAPQNPWSSRGRGRSICGELCSAHGTSGGKANLRHPKARLLIFFPSSLHIYTEYRVICVKFGWTNESHLRLHLQPALNPDATGRWLSSYYAWRWGAGVVFFLLSNSCKLFIFCENAPSIIRVSVFLSYAWTRLLIL